jgi:hypothetical protein
MKKIKLFYSIIYKIKNQISKIKIYFLKKRLEKIFKEIKEVVEISCSIERARIGFLPKYCDNTPDFLTCLEKDPLMTFSNKALLEWQVSKAKGEWISQIPPIHRSENVIN